MIFAVVFSCLGTRTDYGSATNVRNSICSSLRFVAARVGSIWQSDAEKSESFSEKLSVDRTASPSSSALMARTRFCWSVNVNDRCGADRMLCVDGRIANALADDFDCVARGGLACSYEETLIDRVQSSDGRLQ